MNDGSFIYPDSYDDSPSFFNVIYKISDKHADPDTIKAFGKMVSTLKSLGIESFIVMTPYQPIIFSDENEPASIKDHIRIEETLIIDTALKFNIPYYGSFDPKKVGCLPEDFHDDKHPKISCLNKIYFSSATPDENNSGIARQTLNEELDWRLDLSASGIKYVKISFDQLALPPSGH